MCKSKDIAQRIYGAVTNNFNAELVTSSVDREKQATIAAKWRHGDIQVLVSTTCALVGNENRNCRFIVIAGRLYNLMNVLQACGRLRPKQRTNFGRIDMLFENLTENDMKSLAERDKVQRNFVLGKGIITLKELPPFVAVCSENGLDRWAVKDTGCRIVAMSKRFGVDEVADCKVCDQCRGMPVAMMAVAAREQVRAKTQMENKALLVLQLLKVRCIICKQVSCDGQGCIAKFACYRCGGTDHRRKDCPNVEPLRMVMESRGCYYCLDFCKRRDYDHPDLEKKTIPKCPLQLRLRRLFIAAWRKDKSGIDFAEFVGQRTSNLEKFYQFVGSHDNGSLGI